MKNQIKRNCVAVAIFGVALCGYSEVKMVKEWKSGGTVELLASVMRGTNYYASGNDKIVFYSNGAFELRSGSAVLCTGTYNIQGREIKFTVGNAVFYGSIGGNVAQPTSIEFVFDGTRYVLYRQR